MMIIYVFCISFFQCKDLSELSNSIVRDSLDPLVLQPASLEIATIRKKPDEELVSFYEYKLLVQISLHWYA